MFSMNSKRLVLLLCCTILYILEYTLASPHSQPQKDEASRCLKRICKTQETAPSWSRNTYASRICRKPLVRKEWRTLSKPEKLDYISAIKCLADKRRTHSISGIPGLKSRYDDFQVIHSTQTPNIHWVGHFLPWHRYFISTFENNLRGLCGYRGAQPYWNWTLDNESGLPMDKWPIFEHRFGFGGNSDYMDGPNPFDIPERSGGECLKTGPFKWPGYSVNLGPGNNLTYNPHCLRRDFSPPLMKWATRDLVNWVEEPSTFGMLARRLENVPVFTVANVHGAGHFGVGGALGTMGDVYSSTGDPLFWLHHCTLDKMYWDWQRRHLPGSLCDVSGPSIPFDYDNVLGPNVTLSFSVNLGNLGKPVVLESLMNTEGGSLCYVYDG